MGLIMKINAWILPSTDKVKLLVFYTSISLYGELVQVNASVL